MEKSIRQVPHPKEKMTGHQVKYGKCVGPQGRYGLEGGNPLNKYPGKNSSPKKDQPTATQDKERKDKGERLKKNSIPEPLPK